MKDDQKGVNFLYSVGPYLLEHETYFFFLSLLNPFFSLQKRTTIRFFDKEQSLKKYLKFFLLNFDIFVVGVVSLKLIFSFHSSKTNFNPLSQNVAALIDKVGQISQEKNATKRLNGKHRRKSNKTELIFKIILIILYILARAAI